MLFKKEPPGYYLRKSLIYTVMVIGVFGANYLNNQMARERAISLIGKINEYKADKGEYPLTLEELLPEYAASIPVPKYTLGFMDNSFHYVNNDGSALLWYVRTPPFRRPTYSFNKKQWTYVD